MALTSNDQDLSTFVYKRVIMYAITRIIPAVNSKKLLNQVANDNIKLMLAYYNLVRECCVE